MKFKSSAVFVAAFLLWQWVGGLLDAGAQHMSKAEKIRKYGVRRQELGKTTDFSDLKIGIMDNGRMVVYYDNGGFIGDRGYTRSIEWPAGSGNHLLWQTGVMFGAIPVGEAKPLTSDSYDDVGDRQFNPEPGYDNPDFIWDFLGKPVVARSDLVQSFAPSWQGTWPGMDGPVSPDELKKLARLESYWVMRDNNEPSRINPSKDLIPLNVEIEGRFIQVNSTLTKDFVFAFYSVNNVGERDLTKCRFGLLVDPDVPSFGGGEYSDDDAGFIRELNLAWARDTDNFDARRPNLPPGQLGVKFLQSPVVDGKELGLTGWTFFEYDDMPNPGEFFLTEDGPDPDLGSYATKDEAQYGYMKPGLFMNQTNAVNTDVVFVMSTGEFDLPVGQSVQMGVAFVAALDQQKLIDNANAAQLVFDNNFVGPTPPQPPMVRAVAGDRTVNLYWEDEPSESSLDALTGKADFEGYRVYRSEDKGMTWGTPTENTPKYPNGVLPIAEYDKVNGFDELASIVVTHSNQISAAGISSEGLANGTHPGDAADVDNSSFFSNDNYAITFDTDTTFQVMNASTGTVLHYLMDLSRAVGFSVLDEDWTLVEANPSPTEGLYHSGDHIYVTGVYVTIEEAPDSPVRAGDVFLIDQRKGEAGANTGLQHSWKDPDALINGYEYWYTVAAYDRPDLGLGIPVNENRPVTLADQFDDDQTVSAIPQAPAAGFRPAEADSEFSHISGNSDIEAFPLFIIDPRQITGHTYRMTFTVSAMGEKRFDVTDVNTGLATLVNQEFYDPARDNAEFFDGLRVHVSDIDLGIDLDASATTTSVAGEELTINQTRAYSGANDHDILFRFTHSADEQSSFSWVYTNSGGGTPVTAPFVVLDLATGDTLTVEIEDRNDDGNWDVDNNERIFVGNTPYTGSGQPEATEYSWRIRFAGSYAAGTEFTLVTYNPISSADAYEFSTMPQALEPTSEELAKVSVVPNPFVVTSGFDTAVDKHEIHFTRLPATASIKIYTLNGELVKELSHDRSVTGSDFERWNLKTEFGIEVSYGVYFYVVEAPELGSKMGKFAVLR